MTEYIITLFNHDEVTEETTGQGNTPRHALLTATLEVHPEAANAWRYEDNADGSGSLICPDDDRLAYIADPVFDDITFDDVDGEILLDDNAAATRAVVPPEPPADLDDETTIEELYNRY